MSAKRLFLLLTLLSAFASPAVLAQKQFGFDNRKPSGQPYLSPEESLQRMQVAPGYEIKLFAAEPDVINPIAFTIDEKGRLWVVECYEYPKRTPKGQKPRDRIKILEDTDGDGKCDKVSVWAEGKDFPVSFDLASGIEVGHGGVFLGAPPYLFLLRDSNGAGKCDQQDILLKGFGSQDTHETLNTFQWGPDSRLYGLHGVFTQSDIDGVKLNAAVWRYDVGQKRFEVFAEGTSNPWGMDFDSRGQCFLACCVIPHLFHMVPGGIYKRQAGTSFNPYAYGLLNEICDHEHHKESGWAHAGLLYLDGDHVPAEYRGSLIMGSIHGCSIKRDVLRRNGSTFLAGHEKDFLVSGDKNFRPINLRWGPDGSIYVIDWHDQNPCHQAAPDSWDMTHGRIYKIQRKGTKPAPPTDLAKKSSKELVELLKVSNPYWHRTALRLLAERRDKAVAPQLRALATAAGDEAVELRGMWGLVAVGAFDEDFAGKMLQDKSPWKRSWAVRLLGEADTVSAKMLTRLTELAARDEAPEVRLQLASTAARLKQDTLPLLHNLMKHREDAKDPCIPLMIWLAYEPRVNQQGANAPRPPSLDWLKENAAGNPLITDEIVPRTMRRLVATGKAEDLAACVAFLDAVTDSAVRRRALEGLALALANRQVDPPAEWKRVRARLLEDTDREVQRLTAKLSINFRDSEAIRQALAVAQDRRRPTAERIEAVRNLGLAHPPEALKPLRQLLTAEKDTELRCEACRALAGYDGAEVPKAVLAGWKEYPPPVRGEAVNLLAGRKEWAAALLAAVGTKQVPRTDLTDNTILRIRAFKDRKLNEQIEAVWGRFHDTPAELSALIDKMRGEMFTGRASFERGRKVFENQCAKCHRFEGKGHDVGPNLDGAARDIEYLLVNVLDPNRVVGQPYYTRVIALKNGRVETGLVHAEDETTVTLKGENNVLKVIARKDIEAMEVQSKSLMPEGLANNLSVQDFRDLIRFVMANPFLTDVAVAPGPVAVRDVDAIRPNGAGAPGVKWTFPEVGPMGRIPLPAGRADGDAVAFVSADVTAPAALRTRLLVGSGGAVRAWLNGKEVYNGKPGNGAAAPDQAGVEVALREGANHLVFQVAYRGDKEALFARLLDPDRKLRYPEAEK
jgi:putative membrane-bound dehydrogenase-like protein